VVKFILVSLETVCFGKAGDDNCGLVRSGNGFAVDKVFVFIRAWEELLL
jgi:hypothetical protein